MTHDGWSFGHNIRAAAMLAGFLLPSNNLKCSFFYASFIYMAHMEFDYITRRAPLIFIFSSHASLILFR